MACCFVQRFTTRLILSLNSITKQFTLMLRGILFQVTNGQRQLVYSGNKGAVASTGPLQPLHRNHNSQPHLFVQAEPRHSLILFCKHNTHGHISACVPCIYSYRCKTKEKPMFRDSAYCNLRRLQSRSAIRMQHHCYSPRSANLPAMLQLLCCTNYCRGNRM